jgi:hypothetical protein
VCANLLRPNHFRLFFFNKQRLESSGYLEKLSYTVSQAAYQSSNEKADFSGALLSMGSLDDVF